MAIAVFIEKKKDMIPFNTVKKKKKATFGAFMKTLKRQFNMPDCNTRAL